MEMSLEEIYVNELSLSLEHQINKIETLLTSVIKYEVDKDRNKLIIATEHLLETNVVSKEGFLEDLWDSIKKIWKKIIEYVKKIIDFIIGFFSSSKSVVEDKRYYNSNNTTNTNKNTSSNNVNSKNDNDNSDDKYKTYHNDKEQIRDISKIDNTIKSSKVFVRDVTKDNVDKLMEEKFHQDEAFNMIIVKLYDSISNTYINFANILKNAENNIKITDDIDIDFNLLHLGDLDIIYTNLVEKNGLYKPNPLLRPDNFVSKNTKLDTSKNILSCNKMFDGHSLLIEVDKENGINIENDFLQSDLDSEDKINYAIDVDLYNKLFNQLDIIFKIAKSIIPLNKSLKKKIDMFSYLSRIEKRIDSETKNYLKRTNNKYTDKDLEDFARTIVKSITSDLNALRSNLSVTTNSSLIFRRNLNVCNNYFAECRRVYVEEMNLSTKEGFIL